MLQRAVDGRTAFVAEAGGVQQQPQHRKIGIAGLRKQALQVDLDPGRAGEAGVVARHAQQQAVGGNAPERVALRVQAFLQQAEGAASADALARVVAQAVLRGVQWPGFVMRRHHHGHSAGEGAERHRVVTLAQHLGATVLDQLEAEALAQQLGAEALCDAPGVVPRLLTRQAELAPQALRRAPGQADFLAHVEAGAHGVVGIGLRRGLLGGHLGQPLGGEEAALDAETVGVQGGVGLGHGRWSELRDPTGAATRRRRSRPPAARA